MRGRKPKPSGLKLVTGTDRVDRANPAEPHPQPACPEPPDHLGNEARAEWDRTQKLRHDPRITTIGKIIRKSSIDELPQLINVLRGELSLIGPRPEVVSLSNWYDQELDFYPYRHIVKPGITGWAQVNQGHVASTEDVYRKLQYDFYYVKNFSLWLDLLIALNTLQVVITGRGSR